MEAANILLLVVVATKIKHLINNNRFFNIIISFKFHGVLLWHEVLRWSQTINVLGEHTAERSLFVIFPSIVAKLTWSKEKYPHFRLPSRGLSIVFLVHDCPFFTKYGTPNVSGDRRLFACNIWKISRKSNICETTKWCVRANGEIFVYSLNTHVVWNRL